ncbi:MAG: tRNA (adenosine(37)-N6)-threonylcarbamoyltransferase complex ATPase subunit type 1 TsaE [Bacilli bacterium]|nr:tRNA (adenosine(37)-N6)-threonylcarbamoyltransferase complex ATPase subunit type 1 TsaE [Bacilli bacterium]
MKKMVILSKNCSDTFRIGKLIGNYLTNNDAVLLSGDLGSGKTVLVKGIAKSLGIKEEITSPTFDILKCYKKNSSISLCHIDAYRLKSGDDIGLEDIINSNKNIVVIEWPNFIKKAIHKPCLEIELKYTKKNVNFRQITINIPDIYKKIGDLFNEKILFDFR